MESEHNSFPQLSAEHLAMLREGSAISDEVIRARGYRTMVESKELNDLGFASAQRRVPGLLLPLHGTDGSQPLCVYRPDNPRRRDGKALKYEIPKGQGVRLDSPPVCRPMLGNPAVPLWITEGQKKADALASRGLCAIALLGVWSWKGANDFGGTTLLNDFDYIALDNREVRIVFDSDVVAKPAVQKALDRLTEHLQRKGAHVATVYLPGGADGKVGVDDYLAAGHTMADLEALVDAPRPLLKPAPATVKLLDDAPPALRQPLALVNGRGYAAVWLYAQVTLREKVDKSGRIVRLNPPEVTTKRLLFVVRDDGLVFGDGEAQTLGDLGLEVALAEIPQDSRLWSAAGVKAYRAGKRPAPADVFQRVREVVARFIDFDRSLADQQTMEELVGCFILSTWFLDAFNVTGYLWPNGDRGCGKTQLLTVVAELSYLGQLLLAGGSYASLRDLADYRATLAFDDAENLADPKQTDPDKRALLLAGNRRGAVVTVKEPGPDKTWRTRHVNAFCPRLFSAIHLPDGVLGSRSIVVSLIRTADPVRGNSSPLDYTLWPHGRRALVDDLWALGLAHLPDLPAYERRVSEIAPLTGRVLEPWKAILAVALWLDEHGVPGLWERMVGLAVAYQEERPQLETSDMTVLVLRSLCRYAVRVVCDVTRERGRAFVVKTADLTQVAKAVVEEMEQDIDLEKVTSRKIGSLLGSLRFDSRRDNRSRGWQVSYTELERRCRSYGLPFPKELQGCLSSNDTNDTDDTTTREDGQPDDDDPSNWPDDDPRWQGGAL